MMLNKGDTIGVIALAGKCEKELVEKAVLNLNNSGYKVKLSKNIFDGESYLAGSDEDKVQELHKFFLDPEIKLILNARGGYGSIRLLNKIDYEIIRNNPKPFCGFSDITALLLMIYKKTGLVTYHSPMLCSDFVDVSAFTLSNFLNVLQQSPLTIEGTKSYNSGSANGILWGGNLSTVVSLCGQDFIPDEDFIFFVEDLNEPVYKIDKMFQQLFNIPKFQKLCKAIILGDFLSVDNKAWLENLFYSFKIPTVGGVKITHSVKKITIPIGRFASLNDKVLCVN